MPCIRRHSPCSDGKACAVASDCLSMVCTGGACATPGCHDGVKNGTETDVDCGGGPPTNAPACMPGKSCNVDGDCTAACNYAFHVYGSMDNVNSAY